MSQWKKILYPLILLLVALLLDGVLVAQLKAMFTTDFGMIVPRLTVLVLLVLAFYLSFRHVIWLSLIMGFIYDSYYTGYLGIYMAAFAVIAYVILQLRSYFKPNLLIYVLLSVIAITFLEFFVFGVYRAINVTELTTQLFMVERLGISLVFNAIVMLIIGYPIDKVGKMVIQKEEMRFKK
ncbi:rod shape-determining protein MreD [Marinilactibacillus kalidii]|uniref:rod shape-determining protein MreD n=1 Tax=Marinilactibacillus kalidii TaxID=2820274 RepID=UPI001ABEC4F5|nr:rod shape-determining protein MreD [Marinilactibacillus kalidii]